MKTLSRLSFLLALCISASAYSFSETDLEYLNAEFGLEATQVTRTYSQEQVMSTPYRDRVQDQFNAEFNDETRATQLTQRAFESWVKFASKVLYAKGFYDESNQILNEYNHRYSAVFLPVQFGLGAVGDHDPWSEWVAEWYDKLEALLGPRLMELTHLEDIYVINMTVPIVFSICGDKRHPPVVEWGADEYKCHFVPFGGVVAFWTVWAACEVGTYGMGYSLACMPIAEVCKKFTINYVAPPISDRLYDAWVPEKCNG